MNNETEKWKKRLFSRGATIRFVASGEWLEKETQRLKNLDFKDDEIERAINETLQHYQDELMSAVVKVITNNVLTNSSNAHGAENFPHILDVGVATGELPVRLANLTQFKFDYIGIDLTQELVEITQNRLNQLPLPVSTIRIQQGNALKLTDIVEKETVQLAIWGKFGEHLTEQHLWEEGMNQIKNVVSNDGYFLLYEPMQEQNSEYAIAPSKNPGTYIRSLTEYENNLSSWQRIETMYQQFCDEIYTIALWQKQ